MSTHCVYVIRLDPDVLKVPAFAIANPQHDPRKPCVYVGSTGLTPEERFARHKAGHQAGKGFARDYGTALMPRLYARYARMPWGEAVALERALADRLRRRGYAVWQH